MHELANEGIDTAIATQSYTLTANVGNNTLDGSLGNGRAGFDTFVYLNRGDSNTTATRTGDFIMDFNPNEDLVDLRALNVTASNLSITNSVLGGAQYVRIREDLNHNGQADANEPSTMSLWKAQPT